MINRPLAFFALFLTLFFSHQVPGAEVSTGIELLFSDISIVKGKRIGLIANQTSVNSRGESTISLLKRHQKIGGYNLVALFAPEHGLRGEAYAQEHIADSRDPEGIPVYSLHGRTKRPTRKMLEGMDMIIFDIQDIGSRSYTYAATLFLMMEEAAKNNLEVVVLDRPNPINGLVVDGPMLEDSLRSFVGYIDIPYCHGMTIGELAKFFNAEYRVGCKLKVIPMRGWKRFMSFRDTGLPWVPTSPNIPEDSTTLCYPITGIMGEISLVNIGVGYTLPFKVVGAPWINADEFADILNRQKFPGVLFLPFHYKPFFGLYSGRECHGILIAVTDVKIFKPVSTGYLILGMLKTLYADNFRKALLSAEKRKEMFSKINGSREAWRIVKDERYIAWKLCSLHARRKKEFLKKRNRYLMY